MLSPPGRRAALRAGAAAAVGLATACGSGRPATAPPTSSSAPPPGPGKPSAPARPAAAPRRFAGQPVEIGHGPRDRPRVALTFHGNGDPAIARSVLAEAERGGARITVLAIGTWLDDHPDMARRVLDGGHELGNHTQRHLAINDMPQDEAYAEITGCAQRLKRLTGSIGTWFRPSQTQNASPLVQKLAQRAGYPHVLSYDVDSLDFTSPGAAAVLRNVTGTIHGGSVVSLHFGYADTVDAMPPLLEELARRKLRAVTTTELLTP
ncbi:polysaccharide deacetylase family protein [Streptomyces subrutilus]|uniref:Polysaccharide deacetylase n=1 Tax=Streptomyces subrutilus TaxID=36818 RepID=A0A5P2UHC6_9ACTN|nr:polysaccharide deacetylase family protein [Streptomyces subrutilus]QEU78666.1 polysaccharide deacetylase family protein [Streptomyces subrutilus]WSJ32176.1 polysaccharide deacetylase family protein [Streptomyces subrutilus]GGZ58761.1 polysaccharide deacetylase [Streptomyces subrutilus]